jgi:hypothetical protein
VKLLLPAVVLVGLATVVAGCGSKAPEARLRIEVGDASMVRAYRLTCDPAKGTAPRPAAICAALDRRPELLVGGGGLSFSCPQPDAAKTFRISGTYRGYRIGADFWPCTWRPGQGEGLKLWTQLMDGAGPGTVVEDFGSAPRSTAERLRRRALLQRAIRLRRHARRLTRERRLALTAGTLRLPSRGPDRLALTILREELEAWRRLPDRPRVADASVYSTTRRKAERVLGSPSTERDAAVYLFTVRYAYRDYTGRRHRSAALGWSLMDARTLNSIEGGFQGRNAFRLRSLGPPTKLPL